MDYALDLNGPPDVAKFEQLVLTMERAGATDIAAASAALAAFRVHPQAYLWADRIVAGSSHPTARFIALQALEAAINTRWNAMAVGERDAIRQFLFSFVTALCSDPTVFMHSRFLAVKLDETIIAIARREWPSRWVTFVSDVLSSATTPALAENALLLLQLLLEDVYTSGRGGRTAVTARWLAQKRAALSEQVTPIMQFAVHAASNAGAEHTGVVRGALAVLELCVPLVDTALLLSADANLLPRLGQCVSADRALAVAAIKCITSVFVALQGTAAADLHRSVLAAAYYEMVTRAAAVLEEVTGLPSAITPVEEQVVTAYTSGGLHMDEFVRAVSLFLCCAHMEHPLVLRATGPDVVAWAMRCHIGACYCGDKELLKAVVESWHVLGDRLLLRDEAVAVGGTTPTSPIIAAEAASLAAAAGHDAKLTRAQRQQLRDFLHSVSEAHMTDMRCALVRNMARPEEVTIFEDENGDLKHEVMTDVECVQMYIMMREVLVFFTHLDPAGMQRTMMELLERQQSQAEWSWTAINALCWSMGALSGALPASAERSFFVRFVRDLLKLCDVMRGKENRAVIASGVMYVLGQYPSFLTLHLRFLQTVILKLHEFLKEPFPGVKDMAVDTLLKLYRSCGAVLWGEMPEPPQPFHPHTGEPLPRIDAAWLLENVQLVGAELDHALMYRLYEALGHVIAAAPSPADGERGVGSRLSRTNREIKRCFDEAARVGQADAFRGTDDMRVLLHCLRVLTHTATSAGPAFLPEMELIFRDLEGLHALFSARIAAAVQEHGPRALQLQNVRLTRLMKREMLLLAERFIRGTNATQYVAEVVAPAMLQGALNDYRTSEPFAREAAVLSLVTAMVEKLGPVMQDALPFILDCTVSSTVALITSDAAQSEMPEHRVGLFKMLRAMNAHCPSGFLAAVRASSTLIEGLLWAGRHMEGRTCELGNETLLHFLRSLSEADCIDFTAAYVERIVGSVFGALVDRARADTDGFELRADLLRHVFLCVAAAASGRAPGAAQALAPGRIAELMRAAATTAAWGGSALAAQNAGTSAPTDGSGMTGVNNAATWQIDELVARCIATVAPPDGSQYADEADACAAFRQVLSDFLIEAQVWGAVEERKLMQQAERTERAAALPGFARPPTVAAPSDVAFLSLEAEGLSL